MSAHSDEHVPMFLGISHRVTRRGVGWDFQGIATLVQFPYFPQTLAGLYCVVSVPRSSILKRQFSGFKVFIVDQNQPSNEASISFRLSDGRRPDETPASLSLQSYPVPRSDASVSQSSVSLPIELLGSEHDVGIAELLPSPLPSMVIWRPSRLRIDVEVDGIRHHRGEVLCVLTPPSPLSDEERRAIASRPGSVKAALITMKCTKCNAHRTYYAQLNPSDSLPQGVPSDAIHLAEAPTEWKCSCGAIIAELESLKAGFHDVFRHPMLHQPQEAITTFTPLYEAGRVQDIARMYEELVVSAHDEDTVQRFLEEHPLLWTFLTPHRIFHKPQIVTKHRADFGILTTSKTLFLIEIERPSTRLVNTDGSIASEIQRGANQIRDWQVAVNANRIAVLDGLGLTNDDVHDIRYILIGGLTKRATVRGLNKLRQSPLAPSTEFLCFDELGARLHMLAEELRRL